MSELDLNWHPEHCPWLHKNSPWKTEAAFWSWLRGGLRKGVWNMHPLKLKFIQDNRIRIPGKKEGTTRWGCECNLCKGLFPQSNIQVDHVEGNVSLRSWLDVLEFVQHMAAPKELQLVCKNCHKIKSYAEKTGITFEQARIEKEVIAWDKKSSAEVIEYLKANEYTGPIKTKAQRKEGLRKVLNGQS